ncbi:hypothetical protein [Halalkalibacterium ligniniphilum]|uniref:hypothetical protein n=1 Tax=Halalkalibacterium ligniniphilum TaxID=1134413 RepID=UPI00034C8232|nr:hypothetical protein [Halalkalibacterium ligniniphilum]
MEQREKQKPLLMKQLSRPSSVKDWFFVCIVLALFVGIIYIAIYNEVIYRLFVIFFLVGFAIQVNRKLNGYRSSQTLKEHGGAEESVANQQTMIFQKEVEEKKMKLEQIDLDRTQLLEDLLTKAKLDDAEKQQYRQKIKQKDTEVSSMMQELMSAKNKIQQAVLDTKKYFIKEDPMKELAASLEHTSVTNGSINDLNEEIQMIRSSLSPETRQGLEDAGYVDEDFKLTRAGYKALIKIVEKEAGI